MNLLIKDVDGYWQFANEAFLKRFDLTLDQAVGRRDEDFYPRELADTLVKEDQHVIRSGDPRRDVRQTLDSDGRPCWIECVKTPIFGDDRRVTGIQEISWDVSDRFRAENDLRNDQHLLDALLANVPDSIYFKDPDSRFVRISEAMARKFGFADASQVIGKTDADIFSSEHAEATRRDELHIMDSGDPLVDLIERETWPERDDTWCISTKMPLVDDKAQVIGTFGISRDITELKRYEEELRHARDAADTANRAKGDFLANMSHEIRTPMNAIIGISELLSQSHLDQQQQAYIELIGDSAKSLLRLLNEILDFSKIESQKLLLEKIPFSMQALIERTTSTLASVATQKEIRLSSRIDPSLQDRWVGDPNRMRQVMINLIGNAIKFTDDGEVCVGVELDEEAQVQPQQAGLRFSVRDTGIGIPEEKQASVLEPFTQADASMTRRFGGTGLGLAISTQLVSLMGGRLSLKSSPGEGTTFYFTLPLELASDQSADLKVDSPDETARAAEEQQLPPCIPMRVLVAEDGIANQHVAVGMLSAAGCVPVVVADGREAVARWKAEPFDMILMDMHMPVMDGIEATEAIRSHESVTGTHIPIIALTAAAMKEDALACRRAGMDEFLAKPIHTRQLLEAMSRLAPERSVLESMSEDQSSADQKENGSDEDENDPPAEIDLLHDPTGTVDLKVAASRVPGGVQGVRRLAEVFLGECAELMDTLQRLIPDGEPNEVARAAHTLKGSANLFHARRVRDAAMAIEKQAKLGELSPAVELLQTLHDETNQMSQALNTFLDRGQSPT